MSSLAITTASSSNASSSNRSNNNNNNDNNNNNRTTNCRGDYESGIEGRDEVSSSSVPDPLPPPLLSSSSSPPNPPAAHKRRYCSFFRYGRCTRLFPSTCAFLHEPCPQGLDCTDFRYCQKGHPRAWEDKREWAKPCRFYRAGGFCIRLERKECMYQHVMCRDGKDCQEGRCQWGHPWEWRCKGCVKCGSDGGRLKKGEEGLTGAGVLLLSPSHEEGKYDLVLVEEENWDADGAREWGEMGGRISSLGRDKDENEDDVGAVGGNAVGREEAPVVAARELLEETAGTVQVSVTTIGACPYVDVGLFHRYRCYLLVLDKAEVSVGVYQQARKNAGLPRSWRETLDMRRFPLDRVGEEMRMKKGKRRGATREGEGYKSGAGQKKRKRDERGGGEVDQEGEVAGDEEEEEEEEGMEGGGEGHGNKKVKDKGKGEKMDVEEKEEEEVGGGGGHSVLMNDLIYSHKGRGHALAERVRQVLSEMFRAGWLDPYFSSSASPPAGAADAPSPPTSMVAKRGWGGRRGEVRGRRGGGRGGGN